MTRDPDIELTTGVSSDRPDTEYPDADDAPDSWRSLIGFTVLVLAAFLWFGWSETILTHYFN